MKTSWKVKFPKVVLLIFLLNSRYAAPASVDWIDAIAWRIEQEHPDQVTVFVYNKTDLNNTVIDEFMEKVGMRVPVALVDMSRIIATGDNRSLSLPMSESPTRNSMFVTINDYFDKNYWKLLRFINNKATTTVKRPKLLSIMLKSGRSTRFRKLYRVIKEVWCKYRYANYSCILLESGARVSVASYNPYLRIFKLDDFDDSIDLFPTRPGNYSGLVIRHAGPYRGEDVFDRKIFPHKVFSDKRSFIDGYFGKYLGTRVEHVKRQGEISWMKDKINIQSEAFYKITDCGRYQHYRLCSTSVRFTEIVVVVPKLQMTGSRITSSILEILFNFALFFIILKVFVFVARTMEFPEETWNTFNVYQMIINSTPLVPQSLSEKIIYILIAFVSVVRISDFVLAITELNLTNNEMALNTWEEIDAANLAIYVDRYYFDWKLLKNINNSTLTSLESKTMHSDPRNLVLNCLLDFGAKDKICVTPLHVYFQAKNKIQFPGALSIFNSYLKENEEFLKNSKISEVYSNTHPIAVGVKPRFPLIDEFNKVLRRAFETGQLFEESDYNVFTTEEVPTGDDDNNNNQEQNFFLPFAMLFIGLFAALLVLLSERYHDWRDRRIIYLSH